MKASHFEVMLVAFIQKLHLSCLGPGPECPEAFVVLIGPSGESPEEHLKLANNHSNSSHSNLR